MTFFLKILKTAGILSAILIILTVLGNTIDGAVNWSILTGLFSVIKWAFNSMNWLLDAPLLISLISASLLLDVAEHTFIAGMIPLDHFNKEEKK